MRRIGIGSNSNVEMTNNPLHKTAIIMGANEHNDQDADATSDVRLTYSTLYNMSNDEFVTQSRDLMESIRVVTNRPADHDSDAYDQPIMDARLSYSSLYDIPANEMLMQKKVLITNDILGSMRMALRHSRNDIMVHDQERVAEQQTSHDDGMLASEGIVIRKKQFKPGTRASFIKTFHKFQENEIIMGDNSTSLQNTILLHSKRVKGNALLNTRNDPSVVNTPKDTTTMDPPKGRDAASLQNTMLLHSKLVKGNALLQNRSNIKSEDT